MSTLQYFAFLIPETANRMFSIACLIATLLTLASMSRNNEMIAMLGSGVSMLRIAALVICTTGVVSLLFFAVGEWTIPPSTKRAHEIFLKDISKRNQELRREDLWFKTGSMIVHAKAFDPEKNIMEGVSVYHFDRDFSLHRLEMARLCHLTDRGCSIRQGSRISYAENDAQMSPIVQEVHVPFDVEQILAHQIETPPTSKSLASLIQSIRTAKTSGINPVNFEVAMHAKIAYVVTCVIMAFLGIPFGVRRKIRKTGIATDGFFGLLIALSFWILLTFGISVGYAGILPPIIAAWLPNFLYLGIGSYLLKAL